MSKYNDEMSKLHFTDEGKKNLMKNVKENANKNKVIKFRKLSKMSVAVACVCLVSATAFATGVLEPVSDILAPIFGGTTAQTEIIEKIGVPVGASDTDEGITITVEAIIGSKNHCVIVYKLSNEDGSKIVLPEDAKTDYLMVEGNGTAFEVNGGSTGSMKSVLYEDGYFRLIEARSFDTELPNGKNVTSIIDSLSYMTNDDIWKTLVDGKWKLKFEFSYEDMTREIDVNQTFEHEDLEITVQKINISPISLDVVHEINFISSVLEADSNEATSDNLETEIEATSASEGVYEEVTKGELYLRNFPLFITKIDGTIIDVSDAGHGLTMKDGFGVGHKGDVLDEIVPFDEILSITVGEIEVFLEK